MIVMYLETAANAAHYNYDSIVYYLHINDSPLPIGGGIIYVLICTLTDS